ncbi:MAG: MMPL family transporter [Alphaproteobacteria bacterium]|nr:MMPL family transporter [Alphaproteobacteria bacterium]MDP7669317.1 MMPL family transporter [Alphaproteobacteria bacterium]
MIKAFGDIYLRFLARWVDTARKAAVSILLVAALATGASSFYTVEHLGINTSTSDMLSSELLFRKIYDEYRRTFPNLRNNITIVVEGETPDITEDAAAALAVRLKMEIEEFKFVFDPASDPFFITNGLLFLDEDELADLSDRLADAQPLLAALAEDMNLRGFFGVLNDAIDEVAKGDEDPSRLIRIFHNISETIEKQQDGTPRPMSWRKMMMGGEVEQDDLRRFILVKPTLDESSLQPARKAVDIIRAAARELDLDPENGVQVRLTGGVVLSQEEMMSVTEWASVAGVLALILVGVLVIIGLGSLRLTAATLITLVMGLVWTGGYATFAVGQLNLISVAFAVLFIGIGVDFGIQFCLRYREAIGRGQSHEEALRESASGVGGALTLAAIAAAIGFFSFVPTAYLGLSELGIISGGSMMIALFANLTVLPACLTLMPLEHQDGMLPAWQGWRKIKWGPKPAPGFLLRHATGISLWALALGVAAAVTYLPRLQFDFDPMNLKDPTTESVQTALDLMKDSETSFYTIQILADNVEEAQNLGQRLEALPLVDHTEGLADFVPQDQEDKLFMIDDMALFLWPALEASPLDKPLDNDGRRKVLSELKVNLGYLIETPLVSVLDAPARRLVSALTRFEESSLENGQSLEDLEVLLLFSLPERLKKLRQSLNAREVTVEDLPELLRQRKIAADGRTLVEVFPSEALTSNDALKRFVAAVRRVAPNATEDPVILLEGGDAVTTAFRQAGIFSLAAITVLLLIVLQSVIDTLLVLFPLALAAVFTASSSVIFGIPFNFANIIAIPLLFSLGVAYGIYLVLRERSADSIADVMTTSTPRAILFSALTTMCSFGTLAISSHLGTASMGQLLTISLTLALVCTLVVLPCLLACRKRYFPRAGGGLT